MLFGVYGLDPYSSCQTTGGGTLNSMKKTTTGFTIVELLIVVVVIAILATISIVAYTNIQGRARDAQRADSLAKIKRSLELYKVEYDRYPSATANPGQDGWEVSTDVDGTFMEYLKNYGFASGVPVDPINKFSGQGGYRFFYYSYPAGSSGCPVEKGRFYVLRAQFESAANKPASAPLSTAVCSPGNGAWRDESDGWWVWHSFEK